MDLRLQEIGGVQKVAIILLYLGEELAARIFSRLTDDEIMRIGAAMGALDAVSPSVVDDVIDEFATRFAGHKGLTTTGLDYVKRVVRSAVGEDRARRIIRGLDPAEHAEFQKKLARLNPESLAALMKQEHPQAAAVIASLLGPQMMARVFTFFSAEARNDIVYRMTSLERIPPEVLDQVKEFIDREVRVPIVSEEDDGDVRFPEDNAISRVADLLNAMGKNQNSAILESLAERNTGLAEEISKKMFAFDDLLRIDDQGMQMLLREISKDDLSLALKVADDAIKNRFFKNMSERAAEFLRDDMEIMGPVRFKDVETAQRQIVNVALRLEEEGKLAIAPKEEFNN